MYSQLGPINSTANSTTLLFVSLVLFVINFIVALNAVIKTSENTKIIFANENKVKEIQDEIVNFILTLKMSALENKFLNVWKSTYNSYIKVYKSREEKNNLSLTIFSFINLVSPIIVLYFSISYLLTNEFTIGQVIAFYFISGTLFSLADSLCGTYINIPQCKIILERLSDIITRKTENDVNNLLKPNLVGEIKLDSVSFSYTKYSKLVLKNINLSIKSGSKVAIVGKSGSGKSTLAKLIAGLYEPSEGKILFDNVDLSKIKNSYIRKQMGVVSQDMFLFNRTILSNITMDDKDITFEQVKEVCSLVQIDQDIEIMPMSYNTVITEMGQNLSGGQRQKILLARALINNPKILIFDEATNCLDNVNEAIIHGLLSKVGCTRIVIAHRLSTIIDSDFIIVLDGGEIIAHGKHDYLLETNKNYKELYLNEMRLKND